MTINETVRSTAIALFALAAMCSGQASAQQVKAGDLVIDHAWTRATPGGAQVGAGYLTIENRGVTTDKLIGASTPAAAKAEVHEMAMNNGVMTMRPVQGGLSIPPGQSITLAPGGYHIMLMELKAPFKEGDKVPLTLQFEKAGTVDIMLDVQAIGAQQPGSMPMPPSSDHMHKM